MWGVCKAARVAFLELQRVFVRGMRAFCGLCRHLRARASFATAAEVRLWALREQHMCKLVHLCVCGVCKTARVAFLGLRRVLVRGVQAFYAHMVDAR